MSTERPPKPTAADRQAHTSKARWTKKPKQPKFKRARTEAGPAGRKHYHERAMAKIRAAQEAYVPAQAPVDPIDSLPTLEERVLARIAARNRSCPDTPDSQ